MVRSEIMFTLCFWIFIGKLANDLPDTINLIELAVFSCADALFLNAIILLFKRNR